MKPTQAMDYRYLPKIELHLHLDCSLSFEVVRQLDPKMTLEDYQRWMVGPVRCLDLADFITRAEKAIELMQTPEQLRLVTLDLFQQLQVDHVIYAEIRFAPLEHTRRGLQAVAVVQHVLDAIQEGITQTGIEVRLILCTLRHYPADQSMEVVRLVHAFQGTHVVGFDIASDEAGFPIDNHIAAFAYAQAHGIKCTAHAGEAKGPESVWETLEHFRPDRIGHGVRSSEDERLVQQLIDRGIHLEVCPTSNIQTRIYPELADHRLHELYTRGVSLSINTDGRTIVNTTLSEEYQRLQQVFDWPLAHFLRCNLEAIQHAFIPDALKSSLREKLLAGFAR